MKLYQNIDFVKYSWMNDSDAEISNAAYDGKICLICCISTDNSSVELEGASQYITSDGKEYNTPTVTHTWDTTKDIATDELWKYRYIIYIYNSAPDQVLLPKDTLYVCFRNIQYDLSWTYDGNKYILGWSHLNGANLKSTVTNIDYLFRNASNLCFIPNDLNCSSITSANHAFSGCQKLRNMVNTWSNLVTATGLFSSCYSLRQIVLSLPKVTDTSYMLSTCNGLQNVDITVGPSNSINMSYMFSNCISLEWIKLLGTNKVTNWLNTFNGCRILKYLKTTLMNMPSPSYFSLSNTQVVVFDIGTSVINSGLTLSAYLNANSIQNVINCLSYVSTSQNIGLGGDVENKLTNTQISQIHAKGWTISLID